MTGPFREGDILGINHKGRKYLAWFVCEVSATEVKVKPHPRNITWFTVSKRDVVARWRRAGGTWTF